MVRREGHGPLPVPHGDGALIKQPQGTGCSFEVLGLTCAQIGKAHPRPLGGDGITALNTELGDYQADEPMDKLGETLSLPPFLEGRRAQIEAGLKKL